MHAYELAFIHPDTDRLVKFETDLPDDMQDLIDQLPELDYTDEEDWTPPPMVQCYEIGED